MTFELLPPQLTFVKGQELTVPFKVKVACTSSDCSSMTSSRENFGFQLYFDTDVTRESEPELTVKGDFQVTDGGQGFSSDLRWVYVGSRQGWVYKVSKVVLLIIVNFRFEEIFL